MLTRTDYAKYATPELKRRLKSADERSQRAECTEHYLADHFAMQEIAAVLLERQEAVQS